VENSTDILILKKHLRSEFESYIPKIVDSIDELQSSFNQGNLVCLDIENRVTGLQYRGSDISDISALSNLTNLQSLDLSGNQISDISALSNLTNLQSLNLRANQISDISALASLTNLQSLYLGEDQSLLYPGKNQISNISALSNLTNLQSLDLSDNQISNISALANLTNLQSLDLSDNQISDISALANLTNLQSLDLSDNQISDIISLFDLIKKGINVYTKQDTRGIILEGNPIDKSLLDIIGKGNEAIIRHYERILNEGIDYIYEAKLTLVGEGSAGKTSLQQRLLDEKAPLPKEDTRTRGIKIYDWNFEENSSKSVVAGQFNFGRKTNNTPIAHIWDFGGQDVYYPVHRFFLTENSVFVLLASSRQTHHNFEYWIPTIFQFGGKSPIILGQTCHEGNKVAWNDIGYYLSNSNFNIIKTQQLPYHEINLPNRNEGLAEIKNTIINQIKNLPHFGKGVPKSWIPVREAIAKEAKNYACITFDKFKEICKTTNPYKFSDNTNIEDLASFLHSLGIVLWYYDNEYLRDWVILKPDWAMNAVYKIIDDAEIQNRRGIILSTDFQRLWDDSIYRDKHHILKKMLQVFKIAFPKKHRTEDYIIPARLLSMPKEAEWPQNEQYLRLEYHYEFMPKGLINQLSAELSRLIISDNDVWNNAVNLRDENNSAKAQVIEDFYNRKIYIKAKGKDARGLVMIIMNAMKDITDGYKGVEPQIIVPCNCEVCRNSASPTRFAYKDLLRWSEKRSRVTCNEGAVDLLIEELLYNVGLPNFKKENESNEKLIRGSKPLKAFISYSKFDGESNKDGINYLEDFKRTLVTLTGYNNLLQTWDDTLLLAGEDWDNSIKNELKTCDVIFLLISNNFLNTKYIKEKEIEVALQRQKNNECVIIPIVIKTCSWTDIDMLSKFSGIPRKGFSIASWKKNREWKTIDDAWDHVYGEVKKVIYNFKNQLEK
jgi:internalin A